MNETLDLKGLVCPQPVLRLATRAKSMTPGTTLELYADCPSFPQDLEKWCNVSGTVLVSMVDKGDHYHAVLQF